ncbi:hypothetical protein UlMin_024431 [Ulmus minor]
MACFKLSKQLVRDLHKLITDFWWGSKRGKSKMHWSKWNVMCNGKERGGMGFRDLGCFNQALLAKQGWRLIRNPDSLVGKVLKACYFHNGDFLNARKGKHASLVWRSLVWGREIIEKGSRWRVGSGRNIDIFKDRWLPEPSNFKVTIPPMLPGIFKVAMLHLNNGDWNKAVIEYLFNADDAKAILSLPIGSFDHDDILFWHHTKDALESRGCIEPSKSGPMQQWWKILWGLKLPPKSHTESIFHALWKCSLVKDIWIRCGFKFQLFIIVSWQVWAARNNHFHKNYCPSPKRVVDDAIKWSADTRWKPPDRGKFLINVDAATNIRSGARGLGVIIRNSVGEFFFARAIHWSFPISVEAAEALAIKWGIITALEAGLTGFTVASDCVSIINALNNGNRNYDECGIILDKILNLFSSSSFEGLLFVPRGANRAAHNIVRFVVLSNGSHTWWGEIFICASSGVLTEKQYS